MGRRKYYWTMRSGEKIDVDKMTEEHLRNTLKFIIRNKEDNELRDDNLEPYAYDYLWKE